MLFHLIACSLSSATVAAESHPLLPPAAESPACDTAAPAVEPPAFARTNRLMYAQMAAYGVHAVDRVLRWEEAGFPFRARVTGGTLALAVWPYFIAGAALDMGPLYWIAGDSINMIAMGIGHFAGTGIEAPPSGLYTQWLDSETNLLHVRSPVMGRISQGILAAVFVTNLAHLASSTLDGARHGFTWRRRTARARASSWTLGAVPSAQGGAAVVIGGTW